MDFFQQNRAIEQLSLDLMSIVIEYCDATRGFDSMRQVLHVNRYYLPDMFKSK